MDLTFEQFCDGEFCVDPRSHEDKILWLHEAAMDIGGGKISVGEIDVLAEHPEAEAVRITGLRQDTFEYFIKTYGRRLKAIEFFKTSSWRTGPCWGRCRSWNTSIGLPTSGLKRSGICPATRR